MATPSWIGKRLGGRYLVEELLGRGGMSSVYKGNDPNLRRTVAIKVIHPHLSEDPQFVSRFEEEAAAVAQLKHSNIIQVYDFDHDEETYYMVLEFIPGETLQDMLSRMAESGERMTPADVRDVIARVCDALEYAHQRGMVHRDIKPANIMISETGQVILMDFGVAKMIGGKQHTATGAVVGTALYISPEQVRGKDPDRRVDLYALGVTLFEMLSGKPPFEADSAMTTMMMHVNEPIPDIKELNPSIPDDLVEVIAKALEKDRDQRYQTAGEMAKALRAASMKPGGAKEQMKTTVEPVPVPGDTVSPGATMVEEGPMEPEPAKPKPTPLPEAPPPPGSGPGGRRGLLAGGAAVIAVIACLGLLGGGYFLYTQFGGDLFGAAEPTETLEPTAEATTETPATDIPESTETLAPTETPSPSPPPEPYVLINEITLSGSTYIVQYETFGYTEMLPGTHVHFFFDTVPPSAAGSPGAGPWYVWGGPRPFDGYTTSNKPGSATRMCALVANPNHSIIMDTGNCVDLPS